MASIWTFWWFLVLRHFGWLIWAGEQWPAPRCVFEFLILRMHLHSFSFPLMFRCYKKEENVIDFVYREGEISLPNCISISVQFNYFNISLMFCISCTKTMFVHESNTDQRGLIVYPTISRNYPIFSFPNLLFHLSNETHFTLTRNTFQFIYYIWHIMAIDANERKRILIRNWQTSLSKKIRTHRKIHV